MDRIGTGSDFEFAKKFARDRTSKKWDSGNVCPAQVSPGQVSAKQELGRAHGTSLLEALPAKHRASLRRPERNGCFFAALRAVGFRLRPHRTAATTFGSLRFAGFATLRFVLETFVGEKHLFAGCKNEFSTTFGTLQHLIVIFHEPLSP
jgi:hypothetical protein